MLDATAFELMESGDTDVPQAATLSPVASVDETIEVDPGFNTATALALAGCALCQKALGECALRGAQAGVVSPALTISVCGSFQRLTQRVFEARTSTLNGYVAYVLLGAGSNEGDRHAELEALAETIR